MHMRVVEQRSPCRFIQSSTNALHHPAPCIHWQDHCFFISKRLDVCAIMTCPDWSWFGTNDQFFLPISKASLKRLTPIVCSDGPAFLTLAKNIRQPLFSSSKTLYAPSFDHAKKDPVENEIEIAPSSRIVVFEGNYLSLGKGEWKEAARVMDELVCIVSWFAVFFVFQSSPSPPGWKARLQKLPVIELR